MKIDKLTILWTTDSEDTALNILPVKLMGWPLIAYPQDDSYRVITI